MVCHLTDGQYTGSDPEPIAAEIMGMGTKDGNVLIENIFVGEQLTKTPIADPKKWEGISTASELTDDPYVEKLFRMSSSLPPIDRDDLHRALGRFAPIGPGRGSDWSAGERVARRFHR